MSLMKKPIKISEFLGWHIGDGCISINERYSEFTLTGDITEEIEFYNKIICPSFNKIFKIQLKIPTVIKKYNSTGVCGIFLFDKEFVKFLLNNYNLKKGKKLHVEVPDIIKTNCQIKAFIRGLFDTDGSIYFCKSNYKTKRRSLYTIFHYKPKIKLASISQQLIGQVFELLQGIEIPCRLQKPIQQRKNEYHIHSIIIDTIKGVEQFLKKIGFRNPKHNSKIEIWIRFGFCPPNSTLKQRKQILNNLLNPLKFYQENNSESLENIKNF